MGLLGYVSKGGAVTLKVITNAFALEKHLTLIRLQQASDDLNRGGLAGPVWADVANDLAGADAEADIFDRRKAAITLG